MKKFFLIPIILFCGCIYSFKSFSAIEYKSITINPIKNNTIRYGLEDVIYQNTINGFIKDGRLRLLDTGAESILSATILDYDNNPFTYDEYENITEYRIDIEIAMEYEKKNGEVIWQRNLKEWITYESSLTEDDGINYLAEKVASSILDMVMGEM